jgi:hypothetical protein
MKSVAKTCSSSKLFVKEPPSASSKNAIFFKTEKLTFERKKSYFQTKLVIGKGVVTYDGCLPILTRAELSQYRTLSYAYMLTMESLAQNDTITLVLTPYGIHLAFIYAV